MNILLQVLKTLLARWIKQRALNATAHKETTSMTKFRHGEQITNFSNAISYVRTTCKGSGICYKLCKNYLQGVGNPGAQLMFKLE